MGGTDALLLENTGKFSVIHVGENNRDETYPVISLEDLLLHQNRGATNRVTKLLWEALRTHGFCLLTTPSQSKPARVIANLHHHLSHEAFPVDSALNETNAAGLETSKVIYLSEKNVPMYRLGYELCEDGVREVFRIAAGYPDESPWLDDNMRRIWLRALGLMRHITDTALDLVLDTNTRALHAAATRRKRPFSGLKTWIQQEYFTQYDQPLPERSGDCSVLYAMHYFNREAEVEPGVAVKAHVDPSLFVLEPFLCSHTTGLQVWDRIRNEWLDCDGPDSPLLRQCSMSLPKQQEESGDKAPVHGILLFVGKALANATGLEATLHRVVKGKQARHTIIYEQKYAEYYPPPTLD